VFLLIVPEICVGDFGNGMEIIETDISVGTTQRHEWYPSVAYNPIDKDYMVVWWTTGGLNPLDTVIYHSIDGQMVSPDGDLIGGPIVLSPTEPISKSMSSAQLTRNIFTNEYMVPFTIGIGPASTLGSYYLTRTNSVGEIQYGPAKLVQSPYNASHPNIVFNSVRREYLVAYNDKLYGTIDNIYYIVNENGDAIIKGPFVIGTQTQIQFNPQMAYNPTDDTYFVAWEDFRHVPGMGIHSEQYGALLDGEGNMIGEEICIKDDYGTENEGPQAGETVVYNPDKNEFLVAWSDGNTTFNKGAIVGRIIRADGRFKDEEIVIIDAPGGQAWPQIVYSQKRKGYFMVWTDGRNADPNAPPWPLLEADIFGRWLNSAGMPVGEADIPLCVKPGYQSNAALAYDEDMDRFLILYRDSVTNDFRVLPGEGPMGIGSKGDIKGTLYGVR
jgi:hypothetical protein